MRTDVRWNGALANKPVDSFRVRIHNRGKDGNLMIGFAPEANHYAGGANFSRCGWYIYVYNGSLYSQAGDYKRSYTVVVPPSYPAATYDPTAYFLRCRRAQPR